MRFKKHLFISYAHLDNQILSSEEEGWISRFHASLESLLSMRLGGKARIWRDTKLTGNDIFGDEIVDQFPETALLVSIISPRYLRSEWCTKEAREFVEAASDTGGVTVGNVLGLEGSGPGRGRKICRGLMGGNQRPVSATSCTWTVAPPKSCALPLGTGLPTRRLTRCMSCVYGSS